MRPNAELEQGAHGPMRYLHVPAWTAAGLIHGFSDRSVDASKGASGHKILEQNLNREVFFLKQVHGSQVADINKTPALVTEGAREAVCEADAWSASAEVLCGQLLALKTADCTPVLIYEPESGFIAAAHCGWRSAVGGIVGELIRRAEQFGVAARALQFAIGPAARSCCYEVGSEVLDAVGEHAASFRQKPDKKTVVSSVTRINGGQTYLDIGDLVRLEALDAGAKPEHIYRANECTICNKNYFSFRREKELSGRQVSFIG